MNEQMNDQISPREKEGKEEKEGGREEGRKLLEGNYKVMWGVWWLDCLSHSMCPDLYHLI